MPGDSRDAQSGHRYDELKAYQTPEKEQPTKEQPPREQASGRYVELTRDARDAAKAQEFGANTRAATQEKFGRDKDAPAAPMQKDAPSKAELTPPSHAKAQGGPQPTPGGNLWQQHGYREGASRGAPGESDKAQDRGQQPNGQQQGGDREKAEGQKSKLWEHAYASTSNRDNKERGDGKRLEKFEDRNPADGKDHGHGR